MRNGILTDADLTRLENALRNGMTRRDLMRTLVGGGITLALAGSLTGLAGKALAEEPKRGGHLRVAGHSFSANDTLDPAKYTANTEFMRGHAYFNGLTSLDENAGAVPELAESFEAGKDASEWIFKLRDGVEFHDGKTLMVEDAIFSIKRHTDPATASAAKALAAQIEDVRADGKSTLIIKLKAPNADFPVILGTPQFLVVQNGTTDFAKGIIGTGPFKVKEFMPGVRSSGVRHDNYFKEGRPYLDEIEIFGITDGMARLNALLSGDIDMMAELDASSIAQVSGTEGFEVYETKAPRFSELVMMMNHKPFDNVDLRQAIRYLLDRERFLKTVMGGLGQLGNDHPIAPNSPLYNADLPQRALDLDKAKFHLKKAGLENGKLELHVSPGARDSVELGLLVQREAAKAGLTIDLKREPADGYWSNIWMKRAFIGSIWNARPSYDISLSLAWLSEAKWNETQISNPRLDQLINEGRSTIDFPKRKEIYGEVQRILYDEGGNAIPAFGGYVDALSTKVKNLPTTPTGNFGGFNFADRVWLES